MLLNKFRGYIETVQVRSDRQDVQRFPITDRQDDPYYNDNTITQIT
jgi:hypothetical protein